jgi:hypothetical protein
LSPVGTSPVADVESPGKSNAPARADHVHTLDAALFPGPLGRITSANVIAGPINIAVAATADLTYPFTFTAVATRRYRVVFIARAVGPQTAGQNTTAPFRTSGTIATPFDHWYAGNTQWGNVNLSCILTAGLSGSQTLKMQVQGPQGAAMAVYPTEWYIEDIGRY